MKVRRTSRTSRGYSQVDSDTPIATDVADLAVRRCHAWPIASAHGLVKNQNQASRDPGPSSSESSGKARS